MPTATMPAQRSSVSRNWKGGNRRGQECSGQCYSPDDHNALSLFLPFANAPRLLSRRALLDNLSKTLLRRVELSPRYIHPRGLLDTFGACERRLTSLC